MNPLQHFRITPHLLRIIGRIDEFKGRWSTSGSLAPERLSALRRIATIESVGSSARIGGVKLTDREVEQLLSGREARFFRTRDEQEVAGYADLMELIFASWPEITLTADHILHLHRVLLQHSDKDIHHRGCYKILPNHVEAFDDQGRSPGTDFETAPPFDTPRLLDELVDWTRDALDGEEHHPLLVIAAFVARFLAIHPFQRGNGRLSRALTTLLLLRQGYVHVPYSSLEHVVEDSKDAYYRALRSARATLDRDEPQLADWVDFLLRCLARQIDLLERKIERERLIAPLAPLSEQVLGIAREHGRVTVREAVAAIGANRNTIKDHLRRLVAAGRLAQRGRGKGTWYEAT